MVGEKIRQKRARIQATAFDFEDYVWIVNVYHDLVWAGRKSYQHTKLFQSIVPWTYSLTSIFLLVDWKGVP